MGDRTRKGELIKDGRGREGGDGTAEREMGREGGGVTWFTSLAH